MIRRRASEFCRFVVRWHTLNRGSRHGHVVVGGESSGGSAVADVWVRPKENTSGPVV